MKPENIPVASHHWLLPSSVPSQCHYFLPHCHFSEATICTDLINLKAPRKDTHKCSYNALHVQVSSMPWSVPWDRLQWRTENYSICIEWDQRAHRRAHPVDDAAAGEHKEPGTHTSDISASQDPRQMHASLYTDKPIGTKYMGIQAPRSLASISILLQVYKLCGCNVLNAEYVPFTFMLKIAKNWNKLSWNSTSHIHDIIKAISKKIINNCTAFIPVSSGTKIIKVNREIQELLQKIKRHILFWLTAYIRAFLLLQNTELFLQEPSNK